MAFTDKNGGMMAGHSSKWSNSNRRANSHQAGSGSRASRNQGTGEQGIKNTQASDSVDTTKMSKEEKLKYFNSLGLLGSDKEKPKKVDQIKQPSVKPRTEVQGSSTVSKLRTELTDVFHDNPGYVREVINFLKDDIPKEKFKYFSQKAYRALQEITSETDNQKAIINYIMDALNNSI